MEVHQIFLLEYPGMILEVAVQFFLIQFDKMNLLNGSIVEGLSTMTFVEVKRRYLFVLSI